MNKYTYVVLFTLISNFKGSGWFGFGGVVKEKIGLNSERIEINRTSIDRNEQSIDRRVRNSEIKMENIEAKIENISARVRNIETKINTFLGILGFLSAIVSVFVALIAYSDNFQKNFNVFFEVIKNINQYINRP